VIECKFTPNVLQENWGKLSARSEHLYQLFAYLKNLERRGGAHKYCEGLLLYPTATHPIDFVFEAQGHTMRVVTLDLREEWYDIKTQLLNLLKPWKTTPLGLVAAAETLEVIHWSDLPASPKSL
jgi:5-methylcytosine-specific restriction enzyme subunit McrC